MTEIKFKTIENKTITKCPECGNNTNFTTHSNRVAEDLYEVFSVCTCGFDPTEKNISCRYEDTHGNIDNDVIYTSLGCWNDAIRKDTKTEEMK